MAEKSSNKGGMIFLLLFLAFIGATNGIVYMGTGQLLTFSGVGTSCATGFAGFLAAVIVGVGTQKIGTARRNPRLRWLAQVVVVAGAAAFTWFLVIPMMHRSGASFGYEGSYHVTYSDGRNEVVEASVLNHQEWSKWMGGYIGFASGLFLAAISQVYDRLRKEPAAAPEPGRF
jgi:hypothetical protein